MTLGTQATMSAARGLVRFLYFREGHVGVCAQIHYGAEVDVIHANQGERVEDFMDHVNAEEITVQAHAVALINARMPDWILITVRHNGAVEQSEMHLPRDLAVN